jgi:hypothetical protein
MKTNMNLNRWSQNNNKLKMKRRKSSQKMWIMKCILANLLKKKRAGLKETQRVKQEKIKLKI